MTSRGWALKLDKKKSVSDLISPDKQMSAFEEAFFSRLRKQTFDLEGLGAEARQKEKRKRPD
ncbi:hypothetical protein FG384_05630 [Psychrobacillus vulpis]|uniref:Uncharacterized protein n=1 Tax=Psychrobacillus vulpis TaxID=2325572 RepID=A0A544TUH9_9BACI|nr:hypothetical protein FG384_05630 [Psychrobacillus vulpis]